MQKSTILKLRITGGEHKGRLLQSPQNNITHPMGDKLRLSIFNVLGDVSDLTVLDLCAGTGAIGIEALSRGASHVTFVENNMHASRCITENISAIKQKEQATVVLSDMTTLLRQKTTKYNLVFMDPPYSEASDFDFSLLAGALEEKGVIVLSLPNDNESPAISGTSHVKSISYTKAGLHFYKGD